MIPGVKVYGEMVALRVEAKAKGQDIKSASGLIIGKTDDYEVPEWGWVIDVGTEVPKEALDIDIGTCVLLPSGKCVKLSDPDWVFKRIAKETDGKQYVLTHYRNIIASYHDE